MAKLSLYLPPFSPDYSGAVSVLFDLNAVTAMHDASGCTGNYTGYDEPRWYGSRSAIYCSGLREIDAILGDDEKLINKMLSAAEEMHPEIMAIVGSPVPMVIGSDMVGISREMECRSGIPSFGFDTTGTAYYDVGVAEATIELIKRFAKKEQVLHNSINIVGSNPMDFHLGENVKYIKEMLIEQGYTILSTMSMGYTLEDLKNCANAQVNLAISRAGLIICEFMYEAFGIPYLCGIPAGERGSELFFEELEEVFQSDHNKILKGSESETPSVLIIGEQCQSCALRIALEKDFGIQDIAVGCVFEMDKALALKQDIDLQDEFSIKKEINNSQYSMIIADPTMEILLEQPAKEKFIPNAHYGISSKFGVEDSVNYIGSNFNRWFSSKKQRAISL